MKNLNRLILVLTCAVVSGCIFEPDEDDNFKVVDPNPTADPVEIDLSLEDDTVDVWGPTYFEYDITGYEARRGYLITFITEDASSAPVLQYFNGSLLYYPQIDSGHVKATMRVETRSGTTSLADRSGFERVVFERSWIFNVYSKLPKERTVIIAPYQGSLKVSWEKYDQINFESYQLIRRYGSKYSIETIITDPNLTHYIDKAYVGGEVEYSVVTLVKGGGYTHGPPTTYDDPHKPKLVKAEPTDINKFKISWSKSQFLSNVGRYDIYESYGPSGNGNLIYSTTDPNDTTFTFLPQFGQAFYINIYTYSKVNNPEPEYVHSENVEYVYGEKIEPYEGIYFSNSLNLFFIKNGTHLTSYTIDANQLVARIDVPLNIAAIVVSKDGDELLGLYEDQLYSWNAANLQLNYVKNISAFRPANEFFYGLGSTIDNKVLLSRATDQLSYGSLVIFDPVTNSVEKIYTKLLPGKYLDLSLNGKYLIKKGLAFNGASMLHDDNTVSNGLTTSSQNIFFYPGDESKVVIGYDAVIPDGSILIKDIETWDLIEKIHTPPMVIRTMDFASGNVAGYLDDGSGNAVVYNYAEQKEMVRFARISSHHYTLNSDYLYSIDGVRIKLPR